MGDERQNTGSILPKNKYYSSDSVRAKVGQSNQSNNKDGASRNNKSRNPQRKRKKKTSNQRIRERQLLARKNKMIAIVTVAFFFVVTVLCIGRAIFSKAKDNAVTNNDTKEESIVDKIFSKNIEPIKGAAAVFPDLNITEDFLTINENSRPGTELKGGVNYIVIHYTGNPGSTGQGNRNYFESLKDSGETQASSHFVIGLDGEIIQCIPLDEMCYASNKRNDDSLAIECCHPDKTGNFTDATYNNCVYLVAALADYYDIDRDHIIRHYDVTGKECPKYFVDHEDRWEVFLDFVDKYRK